MLFLAKQQDFRGIGLQLVDDHIRNANLFGAQCNVVDHVNEINLRRDPVS